jgi:hypothetical protein
MTMRWLATTALAAAITVTSFAAFAGRAGDAALGAVSGAVVGGPVGAVAGGVIGYTAGPKISRELFGRHHHVAHRGPSHHTYGAQ